MVEKGEIFLHLTSAEVRSEVERFIHLPSSLHRMRDVEYFLVESYNFDLISFWTLETDAETDYLGVLLRLRVSLGGVLVGLLVPDVLEGKPKFEFNGA